MIGCNNSPHGLWRQTMKKYIKNFFNTLPREIARIMEKEKEKARPREFKPLFKVEIDENGIKKYVHDRGTGMGEPVLSIFPTA
jgi:hypothetical protein